jgi:hypothetical protein
VPLSVDAASLRQGAGRSVAIASDLARRSGDGTSPGSQPSHAGVAALNGVVRSVRIRQARRVERYASDMLFGADAYDATDTHTGEMLAETV